MIWIWLIARHSHQWSTGPLDRYFAFLHDKMLPFKTVPRPAAAREP